MFEVYIYFDPTVPSNYNILSQEYQYLPIYVGKGNIQQKRKYKHYKNKNTRLGRKINKLLKTGIDPVLKTVFITDNEKEALDMEMKLITEIGRCDLKTGPLYNLTEGGEGTSGVIFTPERREKHRKNITTYFRTRTKEELKQHGMKSLKGRDPKNVYEGTNKGKITKLNWSDERKAQIERKRRLKWEKKYYARTKKEKQITSEKCKTASLKRLMYYLTYTENGTVKSDFLKDMILSGYARDGIMYRIAGKVQLHKPFKSRTTGNIISIHKFEKKQYQPSSSN